MSNKKKTKNNYTKKYIKNVKSRTIKGGGILDTVKTYVSVMNEYVLEKVVFGPLYEFISLSNIPENKDIEIRNFIDNKKKELSEKLVEYQLRIAERGLYIIPVMGEFLAAGSTTLTAISAGSEIKKSMQETKDYLRNVVRNVNIPTLPTDINTVLLQPPILTPPNPTPSIQQQTSLNQNKRQKGGTKKYLQKTINNRNNIMRRLSTTIKHFSTK